LPVQVGGLRKVLAPEELNTSSAHGGFGMPRLFALLLFFYLTNVTKAQEVTAMVFSPNGSFLVFTGLHGRLEFVDGITKKELWHTQAHFGGVYGLAISRNGSHLASCGADGKVKLWKLTGYPTPMAEEIKTLYEHEQSLKVVTVAFSPDGDTLASDGRDKGGRQNILLWDVKSGKKLGVLQGQIGRITSLVFSPDGKTLAATGTASVATGRRTISQDDEIYLWDLATHKLIQNIPHRAHQTAFTPDGRFLVSVGHYLKTTDKGYLPESDFDISTWDMTRGKAIFQRKEFQRTMSLSQDGKWLATGLGNGLHGNDIATFDKDKTKGVQLWEMASGKPVLWQKLDYNEQAVVALSPNATMLAIGHKAGNVTLHRLAPEEWKPGVRLWYPGPRLVEDKQDWWEALAGEDAPLAFEAIGLFVEIGDKSVSFIKDKLLPIPLPGPTKFQKLIAELESEDFRLRDAASRELGRLGPLAEGELRRTLQKKPSLETKRRIDKLLSSLPSHPAKGEELRQSRSVVILGRIGTQQARQHLEKLAKGDPEAWLTQEAKNCLRYSVLR
jgi:WD40 repeat protein